jgi:hypothetical protein
MNNLWLKVKDSGHKSYLYWHRVRMDCKDFVKLHDTYECSDFRKILSLNQFLSIKQGHFALKEVVWGALN